MLFTHNDNGISWAVRRCGESVGWCSLTIKAGTRYEEGFHSGIAHFTEHTLFKGTGSKNSAAINSCLEKLGGELNAFTTKEEIVLHATTLKEDLEKAVSLLLEIAFDARFPESEVEVEKGVVIDEIESYKDSPADDIYDVFEEKLFAGHPLAKSILGTADSVGSIDSEELKAYRNRFFTPDRMTLTIVSPIEEKSMDALARRQIAKWSPKALTPSELTPAGLAPAELTPAGRVETPAARTSSSEMDIPGENRFDAVEDKGNHEANCIIGNLAPDVFSREDRLATLLLCNMLGGPASNSILGSRLREKHGWVYNVDCSYTPYTDSGIVAIQFGCEKGNLSKCKRAIIRELEKIRLKPVSERRLRAAVRQILGQNAISMENGEAQCISMGKALSCHGEILSDEAVVARVKAISAAKLHEMACRIFDPGKMSTLTYL